MPPRAPLLVLLLTGACGRVGFAPAGDGAALADADGADGAGGDAPGPREDLRLHVKFEGDAVDRAGGRSPGCIGCPLAFTASPGGAGQALALTGSTCLEYADDAQLRPASLTLAAWFRLGEARTFSMLGKAFAAATSEANSYEFWVSLDGFVFFGTVDGDAPYTWYAGVTPGTWFHVAATLEGGTRRIYVDGVERMTTNGPPTSYDAEPVRIGCDRGNGAIQNFFVGDLDDVRLYGEALDAAAIAALAAAPP